MLKLRSGKAIALAAMAVAVFVVLTVGRTSRAMPRGCEDYHASMRSTALASVGESVCSIYNRYHAILKDRAIPMGRAGDYYRFQKIWGPRFINYPDFEARGPEFGFNPWFIYEPSPATWDSWAAAHELLMSYVRKNIGRSMSGEDGMNELTLGMLKDLHETAMRNLERATREIRDHAEWGWAFTRPEAVNIDVARAGYRYPTPDSAPVATFKQTKCMTHEELKQFPSWPLIPEDTGAVFRGKIGPYEFNLSCGNFMYADALSVEDQLEQLLDYMNVRTANIYDESSVDPVALAARVQRWFVSIHPFNKGNGRTSRLLMDYVLTSVGLPPPILQEQNLDLSLTDEGWAREIALGMRRYVDRLDECLAAPGNPGCKITPAAPN